MSTVYVFYSWVYNIYIVLNTNYIFLYITLGCAAQYKDYSEREADKAMGCWFQQCASTIKKTAKINGLPAKANEMCTIVICFMWCNYVPYVQYYLLGFILFYSVKSFTAVMLYLQFSDACRPYHMLFQKFIGLLLINAFKCPHFCA